MGQKSIPYAIYNNNTVIPNLGKPQQQLVFSVFEITV